MSSLDGMAVKLGSNIPSLMAQRHLASHTENLSKVFERLSSGLRINKASDDAAGLAIASKLGVDSRLLQQAVRNLNDGVSYLNIADSALAEASSILERLQELSIQAANGTYTSEQRAALNVEAQALNEEYSRILNSTSFNNIDLFARDDGGRSLHAGIHSEDTIGIEFRDEEDIISGLGTYSTQNLNDSGGAGGNPSAKALVTDFNGDGIDDIVFAEFTFSGTTMFVDASFALGNISGTYSIVDTTQQTFSSGSVGTLFIKLTDIDSDGDADVLFQVSGGDNRYFYELNDGSANFTTSGAASGLLISSGGSTSVTGDFNDDGVEDFAAITASGSTLTLQVSTQNTQSTPGYEAIELDEFSLTTTFEATTALSVFESAAADVARMRGNIGAFVSRIERAINVNQSVAHEYEAARSRIVDADIAQEVAELTRLQVLQNAATAIIAQANLQPSFALTLLQGGLSK